jgi:opacity protein-like surface antigen
MMKFRCAVLVGLALFAKVGLAQQEEPSKVEFYGEYSFLRFNPTLEGLPSRDFNGGGGGVDFFFTKNFGVKGDFMAYGSSTWTVNFPQVLVVTPHGASEFVPAGTFSTSANMNTYQIGPVIRFPWRSATIFGEVLFGQAHTNGYANLERSIDLGGGSLNVTDSQHPFAMSVGGGVDFNVGKHFAIRAAELDYFLTRFTNPFTSTNNQNNFRYLAGVVFKFR